MEPSIRSTERPCSSPPTRPAFVDPFQHHRIMAGIGFSTTDEQMQGRSKKPGRRECAFTATRSD